MLASLITASMGATTAITSLPPKLVKKILDLDFVDMAELIPDSWRFQEDEGSKCCNRSRRAPRRGPVRDLLLWIDCYSRMVLVLLTRFPGKASEFVVYQRTIIAASRDYEDEAWVTYDTCFRRQAAGRKNLNWSQVDFTLYNQSFAGRAKVKLRCKYCLSEFHRSSECEFAPEIPPPAKRPAPGYGGFQRRETGNRQPAEYCILFNNPQGNKCRYKPCRYAHICAKCGGPHPESGSLQQRASLKTGPPSRQPSKNPIP